MHLFHHLMRLNNENYQKDLHSEQLGGPLSIGAILL